MTSIEIDKLEIRVRGMSPQAARASIAGIGDELQKQLPEQPDLFKEEHTGHIEKIDLGTLRTNKNTDALQRTIASRIISSAASGYK